MDEAVRASSVAAVNGSCWHYAFPRNLVGSVEVGAGAYAGPGRLVRAVTPCARDAPGMRRDASVRRMMRNGCASGR